jgi:hypothetical protein
MVRYFFLSLNVLNSLLALAVTAAMYFAVIPLLNPVARVSVPVVKETGASSGEQTTPSQLVPVTDYAVVSDKNLFHPARKIPQEKQAEKAIPKPEVFLYGTLITDDASYAFVEDKKAPYSTPGRGKRQITLKTGDRLSGYTLGEIEANRIVLVKGTEKVVVMLDDGEKRRTGEATAMPTTTRPATGASEPPTPAASSSPPAIASPQLPVSLRPGIGLPASRPSSPAAPSLGPATGTPDSPPVGGRRAVRMEALKELKALTQQPTAAPK